MQLARNASDTLKVNATGMPSEIYADGRQLNESANCQSACWNYSSSSELLTIIADPLSFTIIFQPLFWTLPLVMGLLLTAVIVSAGLFAVAKAKK